MHVLVLFAITFIYLKVYAIEARAREKNNELLVSYIYISLLLKSVNDCNILMKMLRSENEITRFSFRPPFALPTVKPYGNGV